MRYLDCSFRTFNYANLHILFSINFGAVSKGYSSAAPAKSNRIKLVVAEASYTDLLDVWIQMEGDGCIQGLSISLSWDDRSVVPISFEEGEFLSSQGGQSLVLTPKPGTIDAVLLGSDKGISGEGLLGRVTFQRVGPAAAAFGFGEVLARNSENGSVAIPKALQPYMGRKSIDPR